MIICFDVLLMVTVYFGIMPGGTYIRLLLLAVFRFDVDIEVSKLAELVLANLNQIIKLIRILI